MMSESHAIIASSTGVPTLPLNVLLSSDSNITGERSKIIGNSFKPVSPISQSANTVLKPLAMKRGFSSSSSSGTIPQLSKQLHLLSKQSSEIEKENQITNLPSFSTSATNSLTSSRSNNSGVFQYNTQETRMASNTSFGWSAQSSAFDSPKILSPELLVGLQKTQIQQGENQQIPLAFLEMLQTEMLKECLKQQVNTEQEDEIEASSPKITKKLKKNESQKRDDENNSLELTGKNTKVETEQKTFDGRSEDNNNQNSKDTQSEKGETEHQENENFKDNNNENIFKSQEDKQKIEENDILTSVQSPNTITQTQQDNNITDGSSGEPLATQQIHQLNEAKAPGTTSTTPNNSKKQRVCNCKKTKCLKLYCDCFAAGEFCGVECNCSECSNCEAQSSLRDKIIEGLLEKNPFAFTSRQNAMDIENLESKDQKKLASKKGCNCKRSGCLKKYCQCYQDGLQCGSHCKCNGCENCNESERQNINNQGIINQEQSQGNNNTNQSQMNLQINSNNNNTFSNGNQEITQGTTKNLKINKNSKQSNNQTNIYQQPYEANCNMNIMNNLFCNQTISRNTNSSFCENNDFRNNQIVNGSQNSNFNAANILELTRTIQQTPPDQLVVSLLTALLASQQQNNMFSNALGIQTQDTSIAGQTASQHDKFNPLEALLLSSANASHQNYQN